MYMDEVKFRFSRLGTALALNDGVILAFINQARREVQRLTLGIYPERYGRIGVKSFDLDYRILDTAVDWSTGEPIYVHALPLPADFIDIYSAIVRLHVELSSSTPELPARWQTEIYNFEARESSKREVFGIGSQSFAMPSIDNPIFYLDAKDRDDMQTITRRNAAPMAFFSGLWVTSLSGVRRPVFEFAEIKKVEVELWYLAAVRTLEDTVEDNENLGCDVESVIPPQLDELIIYESMLYCAQRLNMPDAVDAITATKKMIMSTIDPIFASYLSADNNIPSQE